MYKEAPAPEIVETLKTWWRWLGVRARNKTVLWICVIALFIACGWWNWPEIEQKPFVKSILKFLIPQPALPVAKWGKYSVLLADLAGDKEEQMVTNIADSLNGWEGIHAARLRRPLPVDKRPQTLSKVQQYLDETGFDVLIWGGVIRHDGRSLPKLFLEHADLGREGERSVWQGRYALVDQTFELPELFWTDLRTILELKIVADANVVVYESGTYMVDRMAPVIEKIERLFGFSDLSRWPDDTPPAIWGSLGLSYAVLGDQTGQEVWLDRAISAYREALKEWTRERVPLEWAGTQNNLGNVLRMLGERKYNYGKLEEAVAAYHEALKEYTRERVPLYWAMTQNNLGSALSISGVLWRDEKTLEAGLAVFPEVFKEVTRERVPLYWAMTQHNLGQVLALVGQRRGDEKTLEESIAAYREALKEYTRERVPLYWAMTQDNLGRALALVGQRRGDEKTLEESIAAFREALKEYTRERVPLYWAMTQIGLGYALTTLARQRGDKSLLLEVVSVSRKVLAELKGKGAMLHTEVARDTLRRAERSLTALPAGTSQVRH